MNNAVQTIRQREDYYNAQYHIIAVQGVNWIGDLSYYAGTGVWASAHPITAYSANNVAYEVHVYSTADNYYAQVAAPAAVLPVIIGEYGPQGSPGTRDWNVCLRKSLGSTDLTDVAQVIQYARRYEIPYLAWAFNECAPPNLFTVDSPAQPGACNFNANLTRTSFGDAVYNDLQQAWTGPGSAPSGGGGTGTPVGPGPVGNANTQIPVKVAATITD